MRRLILVALAVALIVAWPARGLRGQADGVSDLLRDFQVALQAGRIAEFAASSAPSMVAGQRAWLSSIAPPGRVAAATVSQRWRSGTGVIADVFVSYGTRAFVASWDLSIGPTRNGAGFELRSVNEIFRFDGLVKLQLDESRQLAVENLVVTGPDFTVRLPSGVAFVSEVVGGTTALVLRGRAQVSFSPQDRAEQGQLRIFAGAPALTVDAQDVFVRVNPREIARHVTWDRMEPMALDAAALGHARVVFRSRSDLSYHFALGHLAAEEWSLEPAPDALLVDFRTSRHGWLTYARSPEEPEDVSLIDRARRLQISQYTSPHRFTSSGQFDDDDSGFDVRHTSLDLSFDPDRLWMSGRASITLATTQPAPSLAFKLADTLVVSSVSSPELGPLLPLRTSGYDSLIVGLPVNLPIGRAITIDVQYHGRIAPDRLSQDAMSTTGGAQDPALDLVFRVEPRYLYSNRSWWYPQPASHRHAPASVRLTVPAEYQALATGELVSAIESESASPRPDGASRLVRTFEYRTDRPVRYLSCLVTRLEARGQTHAKVPGVAALSAEPSAAATRPSVVDVNVLTAPDQSRRPRATPDRVAAIVEFYANVIGEAPYPSFTVASLESTLPGGHSPAFFALINQPHAAASPSWLRDPVAFSDSPDFFLAHEIAHQWWGQAVGGRNYHEQWISEGFAQYFAWLYVSSLDRPEVGYRLMSRMRATAAGLADEGPIHLGSRLGHLRGNSRIFRSIVYNKSAVVLHMLRRQIGDDAFFDGLRRLYVSGRFRSIGLGDVQAAFQTATPMPLERFFTRWIREADTPTLRFSWSRAEGDSIVVRAEQIGDVYDVPYDVTLHYADGSRERVALRLTEATADFPLTPRAAVRRVTFDDELTLARVVR